MTEKETKEKLDTLLTEHGQLLKLDQDFAKKIADKEKELALLDEEIELDSLSPEKKAEKMAEKAKLEAEKIEALSLGIKKDQAREEWLKLKVGEPHFVDRYFTGKTTKYGDKMQAKKEAYEGLRDAYIEKSKRNKIEVLAEEEDKIRDYEREHSRPWSKVLIGAATLATIVLIYETAKLSTKKDEDKQIPPVSRPALNQAPVSGGGGAVHFTGGGEPPEKKDLAPVDTVPKINKDSLAKAERARLREQEKEQEDSLINKTAMDNINKLIVEKGAAPYDSVKNAFALDFIQTPLSPNIDAKLYAYVEYLQYLRGIVQMEPGKDETVMNYNLRMLREAHKQGSLKNVTLKK